MVLDLPTAWSVDVLAVTAFHIISDDMDVVGLVAQEGLEQGTDNRDHSRRQDHDWHIVRLGPLIELDEMGIQLHMPTKLRDTLIEGGLDAIKHVTESIPKKVKREWLASVFSGYVYHLESSSGIPEAGPQLEHFNVSFTTFHCPIAKIVRLFPRHISMHYIP